MAFVSTPIDGLFVFEPRVFEDERGYFFESYNQKHFLEIDLRPNFVQDNQSRSMFGTLRGLHLQVGDMAQAKLVRVLSGEVLDVAVDLRLNSTTFGKHYSVVLSDKNKKQLYIPRGFAHGFLVLSKDAEFFYKCDNFYSKEHEDGIKFDDKELGIVWGLRDDQYILSEKDKLLKSFHEFSKKHC